MRFACSLIVLGSLLALCPTSLDASQLSLPAQVGLEKRMGSRLSRLEAEAAAAVERVLPQDEHAVQPGIPVENTGLREDEGGANAGTASHISWARSLSVESLTAGRKAAFNTVMKLLLKTVPGASGPSLDAYLGEIRNAANRYYIFERATTDQWGMEGLERLDSNLIPTTLSNKVLAELRTFSLDARQLKTTIKDISKARGKIESARVSLNTAYNHYFELDRTDSILEPLSRLSSDLLALGRTVVVWENKLSEQLESLERLPLTAQGRRSPDMHDLDERRMHGRASGFRGRFNRFNHGGDEWHGEPRYGSTFEVGESSGHAHHRDHKADFE